MNADFPGVRPFRSQVVEPAETVTYLINPIKKVMFKADNICRTSPHNLLVSTYN